MPVAACALIRIQHVLLWSYHQEWPHIRGSCGLRRQAGDHRAGWVSYHQVANL